MRRARKGPSLKRICIFCGSQDGASPQYKDLASELGGALAQTRFGLIYGGINRGLMEAVASAALHEGGEVIGVISREFPRAWRRRGLSKLFLVRSLQDRKAHMIRLADAFVALPGGYGTLDELTEVILWHQLGLLDMHKKPIVVLDHEGFFSHLRDLLDHVAREGFLSAEQRPIFFEKDVQAVMLRISSPQV